MTSTDLFQQGPLKAFAREDLAHLLAFALGYLFDLVGFVAAGLGEFIVLAFGALVVADRHAEAVGQQVGEAQHNHHEACKAAAHRPGYNGKGGDAPIDASKHRIAQVAVRGPFY